MMSKFLKYTFDWLATFIGTILISPLLLYIAYRVKKEEPGPVIFAHSRIGKNGKAFSCYKFRTMVVNSQEILEKHLTENPTARKEWERIYKLKNDPRITKLGCFLRSTSLDELPQVFNVLKGEMSLVGPRPVLQEELDKYYGEAAELYKTVRPGITGLWQISGRNDLDYDDRVRLDVHYINNRTFWGDIVILWKTIAVVLQNKGAY